MKVFLQFYLKLAFIHIKAICISSLAIITGAFYFTISVEGGNNFQLYFNFENKPVIYGISIGATLCFAMFTYKTLEQLSLKPKNKTSWILALLSPLASSTFFIGSIEGSKALGFHCSSLVLIIAFVLFGMRTLSYIDGAVKFPERLIEIKQSWNNFLKHKDHLCLLYLIIILFTTLGYSASTTDSIYSAIEILRKSLGVVSEENLTTTSYLLCIIGALVSIPMIFYWSQRGLMQLTARGKVDLNGVNKNPTDIFTYLGFMATFPVVLGSLGAATNASGHVFGQLGVFSEVVRILSSSLFAVLAGIPGLSALFRSIHRTLFILK